MKNITLLSMLLKISYKLIKCHDIMILLGMKLVVNGKIIVLILLSNNLYSLAKILVDNIF